MDHSGYIVEARPLRFNVGDTVLFRNTGGHWMKPPSEQCTCLVSSHRVRVTVALDETNLNPPSVRTLLLHILTSEILLGVELLLEVDSTLSFDPLCTFCVLQNAVGSYLRSLVADSSMFWGSVDDIVWNPRLLLGLGFGLEVLLMIL
jgi:hypothetical protein